MDKLKKSPANAVPETSFPLNYKDMLFSYATIPSLNGWRAIGVILVIVGHIKLSLSPDTFSYKILDILIFGEFGVRIFFVLSGFLITTLLIKEDEKYGKISIKSFFVRRLLRITPLLWLYLLTLVVLNQVFYFNLTLSNFLGPILYLNNFDFFPSTWLTGHTWSLAVEEQFYLIWPFLFLCFKDKLKIALFFIVYTPITLAIISYHNPNLSVILLEPFLKHAAAIFTGSALALIWSKNFHGLNISKYLNKSLFYGLVIISLIIQILRQKHLLNKLLLPAGDTILNIIIVYFIIFSILNKSTIIHKILNHPLAVQIGMLSYGLYIWQQLFIIPYNSINHWSIFFPLPLNIIALTLIAYLSYHYFERPFLKLKHKFSKV